jgi:AraC-like DNA-binding protein
VALSPAAPPSANASPVARQVGYGTGFALSAAFKRVRGVSPADYRRSLLRSA